MELLENFKEVKVGDILTVRPDLRRGLAVPCSVTDAMEKYAGKDVTVAEIFNRCEVVTIEEDDWFHNWSPPMFLNPAPHPQVLLSEYIM